MTVGIATDAQISVRTLTGHVCCINPMAEPAWRAGQLSIFCAAKSACQQPVTSSRQCEDARGQLHTPVMMGVRPCISW